jgi:hypothetical protein
MIRSVLASCVVLLAGSISSAAIIYAPVQYEYRDPVASAPTFYYGGSNPAVFEHAALRQQRFNMSPGGYFTPSYVSEGRFAFNDAPSTIFYSTPIVTYTDVLPAGVNAYPYGFSAADARNAAYANVPLYFRKADLIASAYLAPDGNVVVPSAAPLPGTIEIKPSHGPTTQPTSEPATAEPILIIPKRLLNKPLKSDVTPLALAK